MKGRLLARLLTYAYLTRVQWLAALLVGGLPFVAFGGNPTVRGILTVTDIDDAFVSTLGVLGAVAILAFAFYVVWRNGEDRFGAHPPLAVPKSAPPEAAPVAWRALPWIPFALPWIVATVRYSEAGPLATWGGVALGVLVATGGLALITWGRRRLLGRSPKRFHPAFQRLGPGYLDHATGRLVSGHGLLAWTVLILVIVYAAGAVLLYPPGAALALPAGTYVLVIVALLAATASGAAFFLDRWRVPLLLSAALVVVGIYQFWRTDHFFDIELAAEGSLGSMVDAFEARSALGPPVMTVVAAHGGGIQAAAWTARVLTGLQEEIGPEFGQSLQLVTASSGGSVGSLFFLAAIDTLTGAPPAAALGAIRQAAQASALDETAWGLAYPDLARVFLPFLVPRRMDRAWAMQHAWAEQVRALPTQSAPPLLRRSDWAGLATRGRMPTVVFNATVVESGHRLLLSNVDMSPLATEREPLTLEGLYGERFVDLSLPTMARLSATFPWVTPVARATWSEDSATPDASPVLAWHVADGGYYDNTGLLAAAQWLSVILARTDSATVDRPIALLDIHAFPSAEPAPTENRGWVFELFGPAQALLAVRGASQDVRNAIEWNLLDDRFPNRVTRVPVVSSTPNPPLSWHLSRGDVDALEAEWQRFCRSEEMRTLLALYGRTGPPQCVGDPARP